MFAHYQKCGRDKRSIFDIFRHLFYFNRHMIEKTYKIGLVLLDGFNAMAMHSFLDPFRSTNYLHGGLIYEWSFISRDGDDVVASNGLSFSNLNNLTTESHFDMLVVNASWGPERFNHPSLLNWLRDRAARGVSLVGLDTGAFILAYAGLLDDRPAAVHYEHIAAFREMFPRTVITEDIYVIDEDRLTSCGGAASADLALEIIRLQQGTALANAAGRYIFHERLRKGNEGQLPQDREPLGFEVPKKIRQAVNLMETELETPLPITQISNQISLSQRQLNRLFKTHTGMTPISYYVNVRLDRARGFITQTNLSLLDVAVACGFNSHAQFTRAYKKRFGISPSLDRKEGRLPFQFRSFPSHISF